MALLQMRITYVYALHKFLSIEFRQEQQWHGIDMKVREVSNKNYTLFFFFASNVKFTEPVTLT